MTCGMHIALNFYVLLFLSLIWGISSGLGTGFWYGETRGPIVYDSLPFTNLSVKINRPLDEGPGQNLFSDPRNQKNGIFVGNTINRQSFDTQFVLDLEYALGLSPKRIYVTRVVKGDVHFTWESSTVIVYFMVLERNSSLDITLIEAISQLTYQVQNTSSRLYHGTNVTIDIDPLYGVQVVNWDTSLRLTYSIESIGGETVIDGYYLNYGALEFCDSLQFAYNYAQYCEFERFFEDDIARALSMKYYQVQIQFIKKAALDAVLIYFRLLPPKRDSGGRNVLTAMADLVSQVSDTTSELYAGNVTIRTDPVWGVAGKYGSMRQNASLFTRKYYDYDPSRPPGVVTAYDRCKANRRCNWGVTGIINQIVITIIINKISYNLITNE